MEIIGKFRVLGSFKITGRGLVVWGDLLEGVVKNGHFVTISIDAENFVLEISSVEMMDNISTREYRTGLLVVSRNEEEKNKYENVKLQEQISDILAP